MASSKSWEKIFQEYNINEHNFSLEPFIVNSKQIKKATQNFTKTAEKEVRLLCKQDSREDRPKNFIDNNLFLLPKKNGEYYIIQGDGYIDIPDITTPIITHKSILDFCLDTSKVGDSEMQHLDYAYASSVIRTFMNDESLVLTIRGRKYTPAFTFKVNNFNIETKSVQTEVDAGYEGKEQIVLVEAKNSKSTNTIIRQLYYPYKQWKQYTKKDVKCVFFEKREDIYYVWEFVFSDENNYNSIILSRSCRYKIECND